MKTLSVPELEKWLSENGWELKSSKKPSVFHLYRAVLPELKVAVMRGMVRVREQQGRYFVLVGTDKAGCLDEKTGNVHVGEFVLEAKR